MTQATPETLEHTTLSGISIKSPPQSSGNPTKRRQKECGSRRGWRASGEQVPLNQPSKAYMNSQRLKQQVQCLHCYVPGPLHIRYSFQFSVFTGLLSVWMSGSLILVSSLRFFFQVVCLFQIPCDDYGLSHPTIFVLLLCLRSLLFLNG